MSRISILSIVAILSCTFCPIVARAQNGDAKKPNVVLILADNVGYGDLGPYGGGELRGSPTPRTDQLAREGLRLTQFLVEPGCTPSRAALMTGQYSIRNGLSLVIVPGSPNTLSAKAVTMGDLFKGAGYSTAIFGKWHLGKEPYANQPDQVHVTAGRARKVGDIESEYDARKDNGRWIIIEHSIRTEPVRAIISRTYQDNWPNQAMELTAACTAFTFSND